jgi:hypothetical protein
LIVGALALGAALLAQAPAKADPPKPDAPKPAAAEVTIIHATKCEKKNVDPALGDNPPQLGFDCLKMLERKTVPLVLNQGSTTALPNGRTFQLFHSAMIGPRFKLTASISHPDGSAGFTKLAEITTDVNKAFNVGGFTYQGGVLVLMVRVLPPS